MTPGAVIFVRTTHGLEDVTGEELREVPGVVPEQVEHRLVSARVTGPLAGLATLRTADDAFLEITRVQGLGRARSALAQLAEALRKLDPGPALERIRALRALPPRPAAYVRASFVGRRNYRGAELEDAIEASLLRPHGLSRAADDAAAALHLRLVVEGEQGRLGARIFAAPLHERPWKQAHRPGSLKPPVAAALWRLARLRRGDRALDPSCGAGTLVAEAHAAGAGCALGGDRDAEALAAARENLVALGAPLRLVRLDATRLPLAAASVDAAAANLPWGRQVGDASGLPALHAGLARELARVLAPGACAALLTGAPALLADTTLRVVSERSVHVFGQRPTLVVLGRAA